MTGESTQDAYERGTVAGEISARLAGHDRHFAAINGSLDRLANEMHALVLGVQRLGDQAEASAATVVTTARALANAEQARREQGDRTWSPWQRLFAVVAAVAAAVVTVTGLVALIIKM